MDGPPPDPRRDRYVPLSRAMLQMLAAAAVAAMVALASPEPWGELAGWVMVSLLIAAPLIRVLWLIQRWLRRGDPRYATVGAAVLAIVVLGTAIAAI